MQLWTAVQQAWVEIPRKHFCDQVDSVPRHGTTLIWTKDGLTHTRNSSMCLRKLATKLCHHRIGIRSTSGFPLRREHFLHFVVFIMEYKSNGLNFSISLSLFIDKPILTIRQG